MQKIMFNDRYGLTEAVLSGRKTQTRRDELTEAEKEKVANLLEEGCNLRISSSCSEGDYYIHISDKLGFASFTKKTRYKVGEIVAVAQSYKDAGYKRGTYRDEDKYIPIFMANEDPISVATAGWSNKMYVKPEYMPERVRMNGIRIERLQDISDEDCIKEGIRDYSTPTEKRYGYSDFVLESIVPFATPREAYAALIDRVSGKGTWERNPYVVVYDYELVK